MIRLPDIPNLAGTPINAPEVSPRAAAAPAAALGTVAEAISSVSDTFTQIAERTQKIANARTVSEKNQQLAQQWAAFSAELEKDPDPASRINRTREWLASAQSSLLSSADPPAVADELTQRFDHFATQAVIEQTANAARLEARRARLAFSNEIDSAVQHGNQAAADDALNRWAATGEPLPEEVEAARAKVQQELTYGSLRKSIAADPLAAERRFSDPNFSDPNLDFRQVEALREESEREANRYRADFTNDIIISGQNPTEQDLAEMERAGQIDKATHARWLTKIRETAAAAEPLHDPAIYEQTFTQIMEYDPAADASGRTLARLRSWIASQSLPTEDIKVLNQRLTDRLNPSTADTPKAKLSRDFFTKIDTDFRRGDFGKYRFPIDHDNDPSTAPITPINRDEYDKAWRLRGQFSEQWRAITDAMPPDASFDQINKAYDELKKTFRDRKPLPEISFSKPTGLGFDPAATYQRAGGNPATFGGQPVKPAGVPYTGAAATVFGGPNDPADNGKSAFGGATGPGGKEGTAIPQKLLAAKFPGKNKAWLSNNVRTVVRAPDGSFHSFPVVDLGTAEWVWQKNERPVLDLTEGAARAIGGRPLYKDGKLTGLAGVPRLDFAVVSIDTGGTDLAKASWQEAKDAWFKTNKPRTNTEANHGLFALREAWSAAKAGSLMTDPDSPTGDPVTDANLRIAEASSSEAAPLPVR